MENTKRKPGRPSLSENEKQDIRDNIIDIARELFVKEGYENTSMRKIAAQAGFAPTKIYYYFKNKKEILCYFWNDIAEELWSECNPPENILSGKPLGVIRYLMSKSVGYWMANPKSYQLGIATQNYEVDSAENYELYQADGTRRYNQLLQDSVHKCIEQGILRINDKQVASQVIRMAIYGIYGSFYSLPDIEWKEKDVLIQEAIDNTINGLQA